MSITLYEKYGGFAAISHVVMAFYDKLLESDDVGPFFDDIDMKRLMDHQTKFVASILGGPADFSEDRLAHAHTQLDITNAHFDEMKRLLDETLDEHGFAPEDRATVVAQIEARRDVIVTAP